MSYSKDMRRLVIDYVVSGGSKAEAARIYKISRALVYVWLRQEKENTPSVKPGPKCNRKVPEAALQRAIAARPDARIKELGLQFGVHESTIFYALKRLGHTRKKNVAIFRDSKLSKN